jgi:hypothetical protein
MTPTEKQAAIQALVDRKQQLDTMYTTLKIYFGLNPEGRMWTLLWDTYQKWVDIVALSMRDTSHWISWYIFDNECGTHGLTASLGEASEMVPVTSVEELMPFIENG